MVLVLVLALLLLLLLPLLFPPPPPQVAASWADSAGYQTASGSVTVSLRQGDRLWLQVEEGQVYEPSHSSRGYTSLNGYRIA